VSEQRTIVFFPEGAYGPTNNCVGIGQVLRARGHRVVFIVEESFAGTLEAKGFEERLMRLGPPPAEPEVPGQFWIDFIRDTAPVFRKSTLEQLGEFIAPTWQALIDGSKFVDPRLAEIFDEVAPDVIVEDNVVAFPAIAASGRPWVRIVSCNPMEMKDPLIAPFSSGYPVADRAGWPEFLVEVRRERRVGSELRRARSRVHRRVALSEPVLVSGRGRLRACPPARPDLAPAGLDGPCPGNLLRAPAGARRA
jgi:UDP:flavonoid glycosyltransferase YjiC (YdhE family)